MNRWKMPKFKKKLKKKFTFDENIDGLNSYWIFEIIRKSAEIEMKNSQKFTKIKSSTLLDFEKL